MVGSPLAGNAGVTALSHRLGLAGRKGRARAGFAAKVNACVIPRVVLGTGDTGDMGMAITSTGHVSFSPRLHLQLHLLLPTKPQGSKCLTLNPPSRRLCCGCCWGTRVLHPWRGSPHPDGVPHVPAALSITAGSPALPMGTDVLAGGQAWEWGPLASIPWRWGPGRIRFLSAAAGDRKSVV